MENSSNEQQVATLIRGLTEAAEQLGLYIVGCDVTGSASEEEVAQHPLIDLINQGEEFYIKMQFNIGDVAWTERVLDPDGFKANSEIEVALPSAESVMIDAILDEADEEWL